MKNTKEILNIIQSGVHKELLKPIGFRKKGRTFNRISEDGLIEVINFQSGQHQFEHVQEIPGLRENLYGNFTVNLGICVPEYFEHRFPGIKIFFQEYDCSIRTRIGPLIGKGEDFWWKLSPDFINDQKIRIIDLLKSDGLNWLEKLNSRIKIYDNWVSISNKYELSNTAQLDIAIIKILNNDKTGERLFEKFYQTIEKENYKQWLKEEAENLNINLKLAPNNG